MSESIRYEKNGAVARIVLDDGKANAMSVPFFDALGAALDRAESEDAASLVIAGRAGFFSGGLDLKLMPTLGRDGIARLADRFARTMLRVHASRLATVAAVTGHAIAGGCILAFACDTRVVTDGAYRVQLNEVAIGIPMPRWMTWIAESVLPAPLRAPFLLHARSLTPAEAHHHGMAETIAASPDATLDAASAIAERLALLNRAAYVESKRRMRDAGVAQALAWLEEEQRG